MSGVGYGKIKFKTITVSIKVQWLNTLQINIKYATFDVSASQSAI